MKILEVDAQEPTLPETLQQQHDIEHAVLTALHEASIRPDAFQLDREHHTRYLLAGITHLENHFTSLDASRPWICFWILHALDLLGAVHLVPADRVVDFLKRCQSPTGGFGGGPGQFAHVATTYASVSALATLGTTEAFDAIDRPALLQFLRKVKAPDGGFLMQVGGEEDVRGCYCALAAADMAGVLTPDLVAGVPAYVASLQTYEGGIGGEKFNEAHGGYAYCGFAASILAKDLATLDLQNLCRFVVNRQMTVEGGFSGRSNKLVDSCYSFWQAGVLHLFLTPELKALNSSPAVAALGKTFDPLALEAYVLGACQIHDHGGFRDKPSKSRDFYHTCYALSGLATCQAVVQQTGQDKSCAAIVNDTAKFGLSSPDNILRKNNVLYNVCADKVEAIHEYFKTKPLQ